MFKPMLAASTIPELDKIKYPIFASPKFDGIRCLLINGVAYSRNMKPIPNRHVQAVLSSYYMPPGCILDGELMIDGDFNDVQSAIMCTSGQPDFTYNVFDILCEGQVNRPFVDRIMDLDQIVFDRPVVRVPQYKLSCKEQVTVYLTKVLADGFEGLILRDLYAPYKQGRSTLNQGWMLKLKVFEDAEGEVIGSTELLHNLNAPTVGELGQTKRASHAEYKIGGATLGSLKVRWKTCIFDLGTGFNQAQRDQLWRTRGSLVGKLVKFKYQGVGPNLAPRFPVFLGFRHEDDV